MQEFCYHSAMYSVSKEAGVKKSGDATRETTTSTLSIENDFANVPVLWKPTEGGNSHMVRFWKRINKKYNQNIENYWDLHKWSIENLAEFWAEIWELSEIVHSKAYDEVLDLSVSMAETPVWFKGARLNYAENMLRHRDDHVAIISDGEDKERKKYTYSQLYLEVCRYGAALKKLGLKANDSVVCLMSNREEAIFAMLATTAAGATWSGAIPLCGPMVAIKRFQQVKPKFLFTVDRFKHNGEENDMLKKMQEISNALPSLTKIIIVPSNASSLNKDISDIPNSCFLEEFLAHGATSDGTVPELEFQQLPFNHPVFINYTSGTTGEPKAFLHGPGCLLTTYRDLWLQSNATRDQVQFFTSTVGCVSWNIFSSKLSLGATLFVFEGLPFSRTKSLWDIVDEERVTDLFLVPKYLDVLEKEGHVPTEKHNLSSLKMILSASSVVKLQNYDFMYSNIKSDTIFSAGYGLTEIMSRALLPVRSLSVYRGEIPAPALGVHVECFNDKGQAVEGERGELVILKPIPSLPVSMLNDEGGSNYRKTYFSIFPGVFAAGDVCLVNPITKGITLYCRSDEVLKPGLTRFGSSEIYNVVDLFPAILDSMCVAQYDGVGNQRAVLFLKMKQTHCFTHDLKLKIKNAIEWELSKYHVPEIILEIEDIPYNMSGKKMELIVKKIINKMPYNPETVVNAECLALYQNVPELQGYK